MNPTCSVFRRLLAAVLKAVPCLVAACGATALAGTSFIGSFSGGGHAGGGDCSLDGSLGVIGGLATTGQVSLVTGGPLPVKAKTLAVVAVPSTMPEGSTNQLSGVATLDDDTVNVLGGGDISWGAVSFPFASVNEDGVLTATNVYADSSGVVTAFYLGAHTNVHVAVLDTNRDNYGLYAGDLVADAWQVYWFGTNNPLGVADATNCTGRINRYTYTADLNPTDPSSILEIVAVSNQPPERLVRFGQTSTGRVYRLVYSTNLVNGAWTYLPDQAPMPGLAGQMSLSDTNTAAVRFYRVEVQVP